MSEGSIVIDELIFPIVGVRFERDLLVLTAEARGPIPAGGSGSYTLYGRDGQAVWHSQGEAGRFSWPAMRAGTRLAVTIDLDIKVVPGD